ncbi:UPF0182 family protein [Nocardioides conyzicola]|uniref:UPF0182 protein GCM10023349_04510 n=1 Tax=Nocardioides conyzicola TaxID=1651781 RepID=A0ABP8WQL3_9ACTN
MSEIFDEESQGTPPPQRGSRRSRALIITAVVLVLAFLGLSSFASLYTDRLWYKYGGYSEVFSTLFWTKAGLFLVFGAVMGLVVGVNIYLAYRFRPFFRPNSPEQSGLDRYRDAVTPIRTWLLIGIPVVLGAFAGSSAIGEWRDYLLWRHGVPFNQEDAWFHKDIGFYVFSLPWLHYLVDFAMAVLVVSLIAAVVVHYLYGGIRLQVSRDRLSGAAQAQISVLLGLFVLAKAADYWLDRFDLVTRSGGVVTGMNYTGHNAILPAKNILLGIAVICAVLFFVNVWRRTWLLPSVGLALLAVSAILLGLIWPGIVQQFQVKPSEADKEAPYIDANIKATRAAYDIGADVEITKYAKKASSTDATAAALSTLMSQTSSVPLVDPQLVRQTFEQQQQARAYYSVADVLDVDRYDVQGVDRALVLGVRELDQSKINTSDRNWSNLHTVYTHGNGIIAAYANQRPAANKPEATDIQWAQGIRTSDEQTLEESTGDFQTQVYFGEQSPDYSIVGKAKKSDPSVELDLSANNTDGSADDSESADAANATDATTTYAGKGGVPVGSTFNKLMYAVKFGEPNFLLSGRVNSNSEVLYNRNPRDRVEKFAPWLTIDDDAYPAIIDGRIQWILDGYTTTDRFPNAQRESFKTMTDDSLQGQSGLRTLPTDEVNYMRNAVKATVDAYDGTVTLYEWDTQDPILKAWESAFPGTVQPKSDIPEALLSHLRYPEDLFKVQRYQYARYHVTDPGDFYQGNDRWEVAEDPNSSGNFLQPPYRLFVNQEGADAADAGVWSLTSDFVPYGKSNLAAFVSVDSDATDPENYGKMRVLEIQNAQTNGPSLIASEFSGDQDVRQKLLSFQTGGNPIQYGNLLTIPVNDGLIYVEPVYAERAGSSGGYPILQYVLVSYGDQVGIGATLGEALGDALGVTDTGGDTPATPGTGGGDDGPKGTVSEQITKLLTDAQDKFTAADAAQRDGDTVKWVRLTDEGKALVTKAVRLAEQLPKGEKSSSGASPSATPSESASPSS